MDIIISLLFIPLLIGLLIKLWNWLIGGFSNSLSDFIYYSIHKYDDKDK